MLITLFVVLAMQIYFCDASSVSSTLAECKNMLCGWLHVCITSHCSKQDFTRDKHALRVCYAEGGEENLGLHQGAQPAEPQGQKEDHTG